MTRKLGNIWLKRKGAWSAANESSEVYARLANALKENEQQRAEVARLRSVCQRQLQRDVEKEEEIERLRAAHMEIVNADPPQESEHWFTEWRRLVFRLKGIARAALEEGR